MNSITYGTRPTSAIEVPLRARCCMSKMRRHRPRDPSPSVVEPRQPLLLWAYSFVRAARLCPGVRRIALLGSMTTAKAIPKDVDLLVTIERTMDLTSLARAGRRLKGLAQTINLGADIFLADTTGHYLGRICHYRECHPRVACRAQHCGLRAHLNDDLHVVSFRRICFPRRRLSSGQKLFGASWCLRTSRRYC
jgi:hypothetical protein